MSAQNMNQIFWFPKLHELRKQQHYSDVTIICDDEKYFCHRVVLAAASAYFHRLFSSDLWDGSSGETELTEVEKDIFEVILQYIYTGTLELTLQNAFGVLKAGNFLVMPNIEEECLSFVEKNDEVENILQICKISNHPISNSKLADIAVKHAAIHFDKIISSDIFTEMSFELLQSIVEKVHGGACGYFKCTKCGYFRYAASHESSIYCVTCGVYLNRCLPDKKYIFSAIIRWIRKNFQQRAVYFEELSQYTDLPSEYIKAWELLMENFISDIKPKAVQKIEVFVKIRKNMILAVTWQLPTQWICESKFMTTAKNLKAVVYGSSLFFMTYEPSEEEEITNLFCKKEKNGPVVELQPPPARITSFELANANNMIYLYDSSEIYIGRYSAPSSNNLHPMTRSKNVYAYLVEWNQWFSVSSPPRELYHSYFLSSNGLLYFVGGSETFQLTNKSTKNILQIYNPKLSVWSQSITDVNFTLKGAACVMHEKIYICEEIVCPVVQNNIAIHVLDTVTRKWQNFSVIKEIGFIPRALLSFNDQLWLFPDSPKHAIKVFDVQTNCWSEVTAMPSKFTTENFETDEIEGIEDIVMYE